MKRILIIDDDEKIRTVFKRFLEGHGYPVDCAVNGQEGLDLIDEKEIALVVTDIMMPDMDGLEVLLALRNKNSSIPVIAISGGAHIVPMDFLPLARKFGARHVFYKPLELADLLATIQSELGEKE